VFSSYVFRSDLFVLKQNLKRFFSNIFFVSLKRKYAREHEPKVLFDKIQQIRVVIGVGMWYLTYIEHLFR